VPLLVRNGKSFLLTEAGNQLYQKGQDILSAFEALESLIKHDEPYEGKVRISSPGSVGLKRYPYLLELQQSHPKLIIDYRFAPNKTIEHDLAERKIDLGLITELTSSGSVGGLGNLISKKVAIEPLILITPHDIEEISWQTLIELGFISHPDAAYHGRVLLSENFEEFEHIDQFTVKGFSNQISLILSPVSKGLGFTVLPLHAAKAFHQQHLIKIHHLKIPVSESLYLCFNRHSMLANRMKFIKTSVTEYLGES
jgi:DNA-binding transcriptional LysR family regulator